MWKCQWKTRSQKSSRKSLSPQRKCFMDSFMLGKFYDSMIVVLPRLYNDSTRSNLSYSSNLSFALLLYFSAISLPIAGCTLCMKNTELLPLADVPMYFVRVNLSCRWDSPICQEIILSMSFVRDVMDSFSPRVPGKPILMALILEPLSRTCT
mgnify:CR=1 FL=1